MRTLLLIAFVAFVLVFMAILAHAVQAQEGFLARITYYLPTGNVMANGQMPYHGAAACSWNWELGTRLRLSDGLEVVCADRGQLGSSGWVDLYAPSRAIGQGFVQRYGTHTTVEVVR